jgi:hypothetical protein
MDPGRFPPHLQEGEQGSNSSDTIRAAMANGTPTRKRILGIFGLGAAFTPALAGAVLVARHAVDVPLWDDWERAKLLERGLDWAYLYSPI